MAHLGQGRMAGVVGFSTSAHRCDVGVCPWLPCFEGMSLGVGCSASDGMTWWGRGTGCLLLTAPHVGCGPEPADGGGANGAVGPLDNQVLLAVVINKRVLANIQGAIFANFGAVLTRCVFHRGCALRESYCKGRMAVYEINLACLQAFERALLPCLYSLSTVCLRSGPREGLTSMRLSALTCCSVTP